MVDFRTCKKLLREKRQPEQEAPNDEEKREEANDVWKEMSWMSWERERPVPVLVDGAPPSVRYCGEFLTLAEEEALLKTFSEDDEMWTRVTGGRLVAAFETFPPVLASVARQLPVEKADHILLNSYAPGQGVMPHTDGPAYESVAAVLSLGQDRLLYFAPRLAPDQVGHASSNPTSAILLRRRSLLIFQDDAYLHHTHGLDDLIHDPSESVNQRAPCANLDAAHAQSGDIIRVSHRRLSMTFRRRRPE